VTAPAAATAATSNRKLTTDPRARPVASTMASFHSCPPECALRDACYGATGPTGIHANRLTRSEERRPERIAAAEARAILDRAPRDGRPLRLHVVGDARTAAAARTLSRAVGAWQDHGGGAAWTYTHAWRKVPRAAWGRVSVLASCETGPQVARAHARGYAAALVVDSGSVDVEAAFRARQPVDLVGAPGVRGLPCPQQSGAAPDCASCGLCFRDGSLRGRLAILFRSHGPVRKVRAALLKAWEGRR
jgi:hypothetical protein